MRSNSRQVIIGNPQMTNDFVPLYGLILVILSATHTALTQEVLGEFRKAGLFGCLGESEKSELDFRVTWVASLLTGSST